MTDLSALEAASLNLPTDRNRGAARAPIPAREAIRFDQSEVEHLADAASAEGATLSIFLLAGFCAMVQRLTGQCELPIALGSARGRLSRVQFAVQGYQSFRTLLTSVGEATRDIHVLSLFDIVDLSVLVKANAEELELESNYDANLFDAPTIGRWLEGYKRLLMGAASNVTTEIADLPLVSEKDQQLLETWNSTAAEVANVCVHDLIEAQVERTPDAVAVQFENRTITFRELNSRANQVARQLRDAGISNNDLVGLCVDRSIEMVVGMLGILKAGAAYVPLDPSYPRARLAFMMADSGMRALVTERALRNVLTIPADVRALFVEDALDSDAPRVDTAGANPESLAYVIYTSGSTGQPKGVLVPHRAVVNLLSSVRQRPGLSADDVVLAITTISFDIAVSEILLPLTVGARIVLASREVASDGPELLALIQRTSVTFVDATPSTWRMLIDAGWRGGEGLTAICTGEAMPQDLARQLVERVGNVWNGYGPTETTVWSTFYAVNRADERILIGTPVANTRVYVLDERMRSVPIGVPGELYIAGLGVTCGYLNRPDLTQTRFLPDPFGPPESRMYRTGDIGRYLHSGQIECFGRTDDQVKIRGFRIELGEIETALASHEAVARAAVIAREDRPGDRRLVAYIVEHENRNLTDSAIRAHLARSLPSHMVPSVYVRLEAIPLTPSGKVDRRRLPAPTIGRRNEEAPVASRTPTETTLCQLWQEALGIERVGVDDDFSSLGGHSLLASQVLARLRRDYGTEISFREFFEASTIARLGQVIDDRPKKVDHSYRAVAHRRESGPTRLSVAQERMWLLEVMEPNQRVVHNLPYAWRLTGELDDVLLEQSLNAIVERHEILRSRIIVQEGAPFQEVVPAATLAMQRLDFRSYPENQREATVLAFCDREKAQPQDLAVAPLLRATLIRINSLEHVLFVLAHNLVWDGWSYDIFWHELTTLYRALSDRQPSPLPTLPISYHDFASWHREWLLSDESTAQRAWWWTELSKDLPVLEMPSDRPRPLELTRAALHVETSLPPELLHALTAMSGRLGGTLFTILFAAFCVVLHRVSGQSDVLAGTPVRARTRTETEGLIGLFMNMLVLRSRITQDVTFADFLAQVRDTALNALSHQDLPFEVLDVRPPTLRAFFTMEDGRQRPHTLGDLAAERVRVLPAALAADVRLSITETKDGATAVWSCSRDLFDQETADRFLKRFETVLHEVVRDPYQKVGRLNLIPDKERALLQAFGSAASPGTDEVCVHTMFEQQAVRRPLSTALVSGSEVIGYAQLDRRATDLARLLNTRGIGVGSRVGLYLTRSVGLVTSWLAVMKAGAVCVPLDPDDPPARVSAILEDSGAQLVVTSAALKQQWPEASLPQVCIDEVLDGPHEAGTSERLPASSATPIDGVACLIYSSNAHQLKSALVSQRRLTSLIGDVIRTLALTEDDASAAIAPPSLDVSLIELLAPLTIGGRVILVDGDVPSEPKRLEEVATSPTTTFVIAPAAVWADALSASTAPWSSLKAVCIGHAPSSETTAELISRTAGCWLAYGFPEAGIWSTLHRLSASESSGCLGRPLPSARMQILDDDLAVAPLGAVGDLCVAADGEARDSDCRWFRTGERGRWRHDGSLELVSGRSREAFVDGFRVDLEDISAVLREHPVVLDGAVFVQGDGSQHARLSAYIVPKEGVTYSVTEIRRDLRQRLPAQVTLRSFIEVATIPRTADGKVGRESDESAGLVGDGYVAPATPSEILLERHWRDALRIEQVSVHNNFFELGGYSLLCFQVLERIERETGHRLSPRVFLLDSLRQIATQLDATAVTVGVAVDNTLPRETPAEHGFFRRLGRFLPGQP